MCEDRSPRIYKVLIMILPVGVVIGTIVFMWMYFAKHQEESNEQNVIIATGIRISDLEDMVRKFTVLHRLIAPCVCMLSRVRCTCFTLDARGGICFVNSKSK